MVATVGIDLRAKAEEACEKEQQKNRHDMVARAGAVAGRIIPGLHLGEPTWESRGIWRESPVWEVDGVTILWSETRYEGSQHRDFFVAERCAQCDDLSLKGKFETLGELGKLLRHEDEWECHKCNEYDDEDESVEGTAAFKLAELRRILAPS